MAVLDGLEMRSQKTRDTFRYGGTAGKTLEWRTADPYDYSARRCRQQIDPVCSVL